MRFVVLGDLHYSDYPDPKQTLARERLFNAFFEQIAAIKPDLVFAVGDTTNCGTMTEMLGLEAVAKAHSLSFIRTTGNHDCYSLKKIEIAPFFLGGRTSASKTDLYTSFDFGLARFVLLDTARELDIDRYDGFISQEQLTWLKGQIDQFNEQSHLQYFIMMGHHPIYGTTHRSSEEMLNIANSEEVSRLFGQLSHKPGFYFCGHNHSQSICRQSEWIHVQTADPLDCKNYRLVTLTADSIEIKTLDFDLSAAGLEEDFELVRRNIPSGFTPQDTVYGNNDDLELSLFLVVAR